MSRSRKKGKTSTGYKVLGWMLIFTIFIIFVFVVYNMIFNKNGRMIRQDKPSSTAPARPDHIQKRPEKGSKVRENAKYNFYEELKKRSDEVQFQTRPPQSQSADDLSKLPNAKAMPDTSANGQYRLQIGAFREKKHADELRAKMTLSGYHVSIRQSDSVHLVLIGPYQTADQAKQVQRKLQQSGMQAVILSK